LGTDALPPQQDQQAAIAEATPLGCRLAQPPPELVIIGTTRPIAVGLGCEPDQAARPPLRATLVRDRPGHGLPP